MSDQPEGVEPSKTARRIVSLLRKRNARYKFKELQALAKCEALELEEALSEVRGLHPNLVYAKFDRTYYFSDTPTWYSDQTDLSREMSLEGEFGVISDTHLGSIADRMDLLSGAYDWFAARGIKQVFHTGDMTDGSQEYRGHIQFVKVFGDQPQAEYVIKNYPKRAGITTYVIAGNHDMDNFGKSHVDRLSLVVKGFYNDGKWFEGREDIRYLGQYSHYIILPQDVRVHLLHPRGGNTYAMSYRQQKRSEAMDRNRRPDIQFSGHFHTFNMLWLNNTYFIACPGMQDETEFFVRLGLPRSLGYMIVRYKIEKGRIVSLSPEVRMSA